MTTQSLVFSCIVDYSRSYQKVTLGPSDVTGKTSLLDLPINEIHNLVLTKLGLTKSKYSTKLTYFRTVIHTTIRELQKRKAHLESSSHPIGSENCVPRLLFFAVKRFS